jgi:Cyclic nucleotide-binding domain
MVLGFGQSKAEDVAALIAKKNYTRAIEVIKSQLQAGKPDDRLRLQLADVLALAGKGREANAILEPLADEYARDGFAAKAISVLKKMQKNDPGRRGIENRLASLIESKQRQATVATAPASDFPEIGMEEIGFEPPSGGGIAVPVSVPAEPVREAPRAFAAPPPPAPEPVPAPPPAAPVPDIVLVEPSPLTAASPPIVAPAPPPEREWFLEEPEEAGVEFAEPEAEAAEADPIVEAEPEVEAEPMSDSDFASELDSLLDQVFAADAAAAAAPEPRRGGSQIVVSPLFQSFSVDEMVAVIQGLRLHTYQPRQFIIREGSAGDSLFMLTSGTVRAFRKNAAGKQALLGELTEGAFFGEGSILTGQPRAASVVAWTPCELLELDRATLDSIVSTHPHVLDVLKDFAAKRARRG